MKSRLFRASRVADVSAAVAHTLAWAAFLWIVLGPCAYRGVSSTATSVDRLDYGQNEEVHCYAFFVEVNGLWAILPMFVPVAVTGLALITLLIWKGPRLGAVVILGGLATVLLAFCVMGYLSFGIMYSPSALALIIAAIAYRLRPQLSE